MFLHFANRQGDCPMLSWYCPKGQGTSPSPPCTVRTAHGKEILMNNRSLTELVGQSTFMQGINMAVQFVWKLYKENPTEEVFSLWLKMAGQLQSYEGHESVWNKEAAEAAAQTYKRIFEGASEEA